MCVNGKNPDSLLNNKEKTELLIVLEALKRKCFELMKILDIWRLITYEVLFNILVDKTRIAL